MLAFRRIVRLQVFIPFGAPTRLVRRRRYIASAMAAQCDAKSFRLTEKTKLTLRKGDLTQTKVDAIVNAANEKMLGGGGVDGAIHRAAGPELLKACYKASVGKCGIRCPTGEARLTEGYKLPAKYVIHTVGPIYKSEEESAPLLYNAYKNSLAIANQKGFKDIAFPAISCGVYLYPIPAAARIALQACKEHAGNLEEIVFVLFSYDTYTPYLEAAEQSFPAL